MAEDYTNLNIHQKLLKIADAAGVLRKNKDGFNYKYTTEDEIQAKVTAGMQKYGVMLYPSLVPGTLSVTPYHYEKVKTKRENGKSVDVVTPVNEIIVTSEVIYTWVNADTPTDTVECHWAYIGQMEDASQALGAGMTYGNRYFLLKALQLATTEDDPDNYRSKQKEAETYDEQKEAKAAEEELKKAIKEIIDKGTELIKAGFKKEEVMAIVGKHNDGNQNPSSIKSKEVCDTVMAALNKLTKPAAPTEKKTTAKAKGVKE